MIFMTFDFAVDDDSQATVIEDLRAVAKKAQSNPGCIECRIYRDLDNRGTLTYMEKWRSHSGLVGYFLTLDFTRLMAITNRMSVRPEIKVYSVARTNGREMIDAVRGGMPFTATMLQPALN